jgi:hypothetical protein
LTTLELGQSPLDLTVTVARQGACSFALEFWTDSTLTVHADLTGVTVRLAVDQTGTDLEWDAITVDGVATWTLDEDDTDLAAGHYDTRLLLIQTGSTFVAATGDLVVVS